LTLRGYPFGSGKSPNPSRGRTLLRISKKVTQKWSEEEIREFIQSTDT